MLRLKPKTTTKDDIFPPQQKRLRILGEEEIAALYDRPHFTPDERAEYVKGQ
jgi:hypothetical protein